ncbi:hypothetical protein B0H14DRAFT_3481403 [Mycena olivaceomarginata]|nr:hypothetical protein B0H14DRAFT_3481403 [Mycena olivaceomarginata]
MAPANHLHNSFLARPTLSPISQTPSSLSNSLPCHRQQDTTVPRLYSHLLPTTQGRIHISDDRDRRSPGRHGRCASPSTRYDRSPPVAERVADPSCCRFYTTSRAGRTLPVPDADPTDKAELILTPPPPPLHTTHRLAEGDRSSLPLPERSSTFRCDHQAVPEALIVL